MDCEYHFALTQRAKQDVRQNVGYIRNELGNEKAAGMLMNELDKCIERLCIFQRAGSWYLMNICRASMCAGR